MIATVVPFFLFATVPNNPVWKHGPEFVFNSTATAVAEGFKGGEVTQGMTVDNEIICRQKDLNTLTCGFRHLNFDFFDHNANNQATQEHSKHHNHGPSHEGPLHHIYGTIPFEVKFNQRGVESIIVERSATTDFRADLVKSVANLLNTGVDLSGVEFKPTNQVRQTKEQVNFLLGKCEANVGVQFKDNTAEQGPNHLQLELAAPLPNLNGRELALSKYRESQDCVRDLKFFWSGLVLKELDKDPNLSFSKAVDYINVDRESYKARTDIKMKTVRHNDRISLEERFTLDLAEVRAAKGAPQQIQDPVTIKFDNSA